MLHLQAQAADRRRTQDSNVEAIAGTPGNDALVIERFMIGLAEIKP
jgi:hypothetical protein